MLGAPLPRAIITGVTGQDGHYLVDLLRSNDYETWGVVRNLDSPQVKRLKLEFPFVQVVQGDLTSMASVTTIIDSIRPDEIYNLGAISSVKRSFDIPELVADVNGLGPLRILEAIRNLQMFNVRVYQASSSEMYGKPGSTPQSELSPFRPRSPYGVAKLLAHNMCGLYRDAYSMWISCGILYNHESPRRSDKFVTRKISMSIARIKRGMQSQFSLGDVHQKRDWGFAGDYVEAMWRMLQVSAGGDYVIATGQSHSVADFVDMCAASAGLTGTWQNYVRVDSSLIRPTEVEDLVGDITKAKNELGWRPRVSTEALADMMVTADLRRLDRCR